MSALQRSTVVILAVVAVVAALVWLQSGDSSAKDKGGPSGVSSALASQKANGQSYVAEADLPAEAKATIVKIKAGGSFPYAQDGIVFQNREGLLPVEPTGFYHEYTVPTPGASDRGARRIVQGSTGVLYWTADHYKTFRQIRLSPS